MRQQFCMFCMADLNQEIRKTLGKDPGYVNDPSSFGRTREELEEYLSRGNTSVYKNADTETIKKTSEIPQQEAREEMVMANLLNEFAKDSPPVTLDVVGSEDFHLSFTLPGNIPEKIKAGIYEQMKQFFIDSAKFALQSNAYGRYIADPDNKAPQSPMAPFGG